MINDIDSLTDDRIRIMLRQALMCLVLLYITCHERVVKAALPPIHLLKLRERIHGIRTISNSVVVVVVVACISAGVLMQVMMSQFAFFPFFIFLLPGAPIPYLHINLKLSKIEIA